MPREAFCATKNPRTECVSRQNGPIRQRTECLSRHMGRFDNARNAPRAIWADSVPHEMPVAAGCGQRATHGMPLVAGCAHRPPPTVQRTQRLSRHADQSHTVRSASCDIPSHGMSLAALQRTLWWCKGEHWGFPCEYRTLHALPATISKSHARQTPRVVLWDSVDVYQGERKHPWHCGRVGSKKA